MKLSEDKELTPRAAYHRFRYWVWMWRAFVLSLIALFLPIYDPPSLGVAVLPWLGGVLCVWFMMTENALEGDCNGDCKANHKLRRFWE